MLKTFVRQQVCHGGAGELEGAAARLEWDQIPRGPLRGKGRGEQSEDFSALERAEK